MKRVLEAAAIATVGIMVGAGGMQVLRAQSTLPVISVAESPAVGRQST
jgi:hypothetical protein